jgi:hypothetical protein
LVHSYNTIWHNNPGHLYLHIHENVKYYDMFFQEIQYLNWIPAQN